MPKNTSDFKIRRNRFNKQKNMTMDNAANETNLEAPDPATTATREIVKTKHKTGPMGMIKSLLPSTQTIFKISILFLGYILSCLHSSFVLLIIAVVTLIWYERRENSSFNRIKIKSEACSTSKQELKRKIEEIPAWVKFPDRERAEWLNQVIAQVWPTVNNYVIKLFRGSIQAKIRKKYETFRFEEIDFGCNPPKIDGIKVYNCNTTKDSIIIDSDVFYDGNCDINFSLSGAQIGGIRDFQLSVEVRVVLKPLLLKMPLIGGIQIFFLNTPDMSFTLDGLSAIPGLSYFIRTKIEERLMKLIVYPNKFTKRFSKSVEPSELKALEPAGVLRVHVSEAKDLMAKDITGKSDPYAVICVGAQEYRTHYIDQSLNPKWDYWCEFIILDPMAQHVDFKLFDHDKVNEDDFLGSGDVDISTVVKGKTDQWINLDNAKRGKIHLRFTWLSLTSDIGALDTICEETKLLKVTDVNTAVLAVYVDSAQNLPLTKPFVKPNPYFILKVGNKTQKSKIKKHTTDPAWEQGFVFLVPNPKNDMVCMTIRDKQTDNILTQFTYLISDLFQKPNLALSKSEFDLANGTSKITLSLQLRILTNDMYDLEEDESDSDSDNEASLQRNSNRSSTKSTSSLKKEVIEEHFKSSTTAVNSASIRAPLARTESNISAGKHELGKIELTLAYSEPRQKFVVTIHRIANLQMKDQSDIPDPYVKIELNSNTSGHSIKHKTKVKVDSCNPVYDETFDYLLSKSEVYDHVLSVSVKTKKFFNNQTIARVEINLKYVDFSSQKKAWFDLEPK